jgi:hypothetical protein
LPSATGRKLLSLKNISKALPAVSLAKSDSEKYGGELSFGRKVFSLMARECGYRCNEVAAYLNKDPSGITVHARVGEKLSMPIKELREYLDHISTTQA